MPSSIHKLLIHGKEIIKHFGMIPIGVLSEDAQESRNKCYKETRRFHSRKCSRYSTNEDVFNYLLYSSDPYISSLRNKYSKYVKTLDDDAIKLLENSEYLHSVTDDSED